MTRLIASRYGARLAALVLGWLVTTLTASGAEFAALARQPALVALALLVGTWALHVATSYADSGTFAIDPPMEARPAPPPPPPPAAYEQPLHRAPGLAELPPMPSQTIRIP